MAHSTSAAAKISGKHRATIMRAIESGDLVATRSGEAGHWQIADADLKRWMAKADPKSKSAVVTTERKSRRPDMGRAVNATAPQLKAAECDCGKLKDAERIAEERGNALTAAEAKVVELESAVEALNIKVRDLEPYKKRSTDLADELANANNAASEALQSASAKTEQIRGLDTRLGAANRQVADLQVILDDIEPRMKRAEARVEELLKPKSLLERIFG